MKINFSSIKVYINQEIQKLYSVFAPILHSHGNITSNGMIGDSNNNANKNVVTNRNGQIVIEDKPEIPTNISDLTNDSDFIEKSSTTGYIKNDGTVGTPTNTTYTAGTGLTLSSNTFSLTDASNYVKKSNTNGYIKNDGTISNPVNGYLTETNANNTYSPLTHNHDTQYIKTAIEITSSSALDLNDAYYKNQGLYNCPLTATAKLMSNTPWGNQSNNAVAFSLTVLKTTANGVKQILYPYFATDNTIYIRGMYNNSWGDWSAISLEGHTHNYIPNTTGSVTSNHILNGTIVNGDIADGTITGTKLAEKTITAGRIGDGAITTTNLGDGKVTYAKLNTDVYDTTIGGTNNSTKLITSNAVYQALNKKQNIQDNWCGSIDTTHWYLKPISFEIKGGYTDRPITFRLDSRRPNPIYVTIIFRNEGNTDPHVATFETTGGDNICYLYKEATSKWSLIVKKSELYDGLAINQLVNNNSNITITYPNESLETLPTSNILQSRYVTENINPNLLDNTKEFTDVGSENGVASTVASYTYKGCTVRYLSGGQSQNVGFYWTIPLEKLKLGGIYTLSFWARTDASHQSLITYFYQGVTARRIKSNTSVFQAIESAYGDGATQFSLTMGWRRYYVVYQLNSTGTMADKRLLLRLTTTATSSSQNLIVCGVKFEEGNHATAYCGSGNDAKITSHSQKLIPSSVSLNDYTKEGWYYNNSNASVKTITNTPWTEANNVDGSLAFSMEVFYTYGVVQVLYPYTGDDVWIRRSRSPTANWTAWRKIYNSGNLTKAIITDLGIPAQDTVYTHPSSHPSTFISNDQKYNNIKSGESTTLTLTTQKLINDNINSTLGNKVDKVSGKGLSTNDFTATYKTNLDNLVSSTATTKNAHVHGYITSDGKVTTTTTNVTRVLVTDGDTVKSISKLPSSNVTHQDISGKENSTNKVTSISSSSTDTQYPSAKAVYGYAQPKLSNSSWELVSNMNSTNYGVTLRVYVNKYLRLGVAEVSGTCSLSAGKNTIFSSGGEVKNLANNTVPSDSTISLKPLAHSYGICHNAGNVLIRVQVDGDIIMYNNSSSTDISIYGSAYFRF